MFESVFKLSFSVSEDSPIEIDVSVGVYNEGVLHVLGRKLSARVWECWSNKYGSDFIPFAVTGFGELLLWNANKKWVEHFCPQTEHFEFIDRDVDWVLNEFFVLEEVLESVFKVDILHRLVVKNGPVQYGSCFILQPWQRFGGQDSTMNFIQGDLVVYHALVAQS